MFAPALRRHGCNRTFHNLQQCLLHPFARYIAGDRRVVGLAGNLVDLVDIDNAALRTLNIIVGGLQQLQNDILDIFANIARLCQRCGIGHGERHIQHTCQRLGQQRLAAPGRAHKQDV